MEYYEVKIIDSFHFRIRLTQQDITTYFTYKTRGLHYNVYLHRQVYVDTTNGMYYYPDRKCEMECISQFLVGMAPYVYGMLFDKLPENSKKLLENLIFSPEFKIQREDLFSLTDEQFTDVTQMLTCRRGLFQCYTGYGKTEVIAALSKFLLRKTDDNILIVTVNSSAKSEIANRLLKKFDIDATHYLDLDKRINIITSHVLRSNSYVPKDPRFRKIKWILADEVEYCATGSLSEFYESDFPQPIHMYGFSATAEAEKAEPIRTRLPEDLYDQFVHENITLGGRIDNRGFKKFKEDRFQYLKTKLGENSTVVGYYGATVVFKKPKRNRIVKLINVKGEFLRKFKEDFKQYNECIQGITNLMLTDSDLIRLINAIVYKRGLSFLPLITYEVVDEYIKSFTKFDFVCAFLHGGGIVDYYTCGEYLGSSNIEELKDIIKDHEGLIGFLTSTAAGYRAIDMQGLSRVILITSNKASVILQAIGRARDRELEIINLIPGCSIPMYSKQLDRRRNMIRSYFEDCSLTEYNQTSSEYGID